MVKIDISLGELADRISILKVKIKHPLLFHSEKIISMEQELEDLRSKQPLESTSYDSLLDNLEKVNYEIFELEEIIRTLPSWEDRTYAELSYSCRKLNDSRFYLKQQINTISNNFGVSQEYKSFDK